MSVGVMGGPGREWACLPWFFSQDQSWGGAGAAEEEVSQLHIRQWIKLLRNEDS